jgi:hypothetical protein
MFGDQVDNGDTYDDQDVLTTNNYNTLQIVDEDVDELRASYRKKFSMHDLTEDRTKSQTSLPEKEIVNIKTPSIPTVEVKRTNDYDTFGQANGE